MNKTTKPTAPQIQPYSKLVPLLVPKERLLLWEKARGLWQNRQPDPAREAEKIREEWERALPKLT